MAEGIRVPPHQAELTERALRARGVCNWLVSWDPDGEWVEYCGGKAYFRGLCSGHSFHWFTEEEPDR